MSVCLDSRISRTTPVDGEMDRLRILTRSDFGHVTHGLSQLPDFKQETSALPHFIIKQEVPNNNGQQVVVKQEMPDPHQSDHKQNFKNCVALPIPFPPTPTEDTSENTKSGLMVHGPETSVDYPVDVAETQRKISELASWLQAPPNNNGSSNGCKVEPQHGKIIYQTDHFLHSSGLSNSGNPTAIWSKSAPTSPLSPGSPSDNRIIRSASSSPIRHQTVLPNPCLRKPFNRSSSLSQEPILSNHNSTIDGEPIAKRRPAPLASMGTMGIQNGTTTRFTPIPVPDSPNFSSITFDRNESIPINPQEVQIGMLPDQLTGMRLPSEASGQSILITSSNGTTPAKVQHIVVRNDNIKQEYYVSDSSTDITITTNNTSLLNNNNDHIRNQRTGRKCRKVYGVSNRQEWCTACRWKKACRRFPS
jgi:hypothetical protein